MITQEQQEQAVVQGEVVDAPQDTQQDDFEAEFTAVIEKAGLVAFTPGGSIFLVHTSADPNKWVLPKGHVEESDKSLIECAVREFQEEVGFDAELITDQPVAKIDRQSQMYDPDIDETVDVIERVTFYLANATNYLHDPERSTLIIRPTEAIRKVRV